MVTVTFLAKEETLVSTEKAAKAVIFQTGVNYHKSADVHMVYFNKLVSL